jgi:hypothetical protein
VENYFGTGEKHERPQSRELTDALTLCHLARKRHACRMIKELLKFIAMADVENAREKGGKEKR